MNDSGRLEGSIGRVLRIGVTTSSACLATGLLLEVAGAGRAATVLLNAGLVILMATPVGRVVISFAEYLIERDWLFATLTGIVLAELMASVFAAFG